ncbi:hypothetical protein NDU88_010217 [Pleurodeles waltl]|uniref:Uncharacterized protein n=1 Tax=Pleurodeles waltl TaxID=8319 RepID=A0AAV7PUA3_PLEWA|nr:hypothetical protein NDU88_010217 [Pleurodeles waltl]
MWDKVVLGRPGWAGRVSGVDGSDWKNSRESQMEVSVERGASNDSIIEIKQDGTMAVVVPDLAAVLTVAPDLGVEMISVDS